MDPKDIIDIEILIDHASQYDAEVRVDDNGTTGHMTKDPQTCTLHTGILEDYVC